jgi:hypothetical protein
VLTAFVEVGKALYGQITAIPNPKRSAVGEGSAPLPHRVSPLKFTGFAAAFVCFVDFIFISPRPGDSGLNEVESGGSRGEATLKFGTAHSMNP